MPSLSGRKPASWQKMHVASPPVATYWISIKSLSDLVITGTEGEGIRIGDVVSVMGSLDYDAYRAGMSLGNLVVREYHSGLVASVGMPSPEGIQDLPQADRSW